MYNKRTIGEVLNDMKEFIGRKEELSALKNWNNADMPQLTAIFGRRRVGKTRLVEEASKGSKILLFEGLEGQSSAVQRAHFRDTLSNYAGSRVYRELRSDNWSALLISLSEFIAKERFIVLFDEFQWMAAERSQFVSTVKYVWDNFYSKSNCIHLILCGSVSSFIVKKVIHSKALYGRINLKIHLKPLKLGEIKNGFLKTLPKQHIVQIYSALGGVPKYLELCDPKGSFEQNMSKLFFSPYAPLQDELQNLFVSHFGKKSIYLKTVKFLSDKHSAKRSEISKALSVSSGGALTKVLEELQLAGFIDECAHISGIVKSKEKIFRLVDPFLRFYLKFVFPRLKSLESLRKPLSLQEALPGDIYKTWRGLAFETTCRLHAQEIAHSLGFSAVDYEVGTLPAKKGVPQIDLAFSRSDGVITICKIKFKDQIGLEVVEQSKKQIEKLQSQTKKHLEASLISFTKPTKAVYKENYFVKILDHQALFQAL